MTSITTNGVLVGPIASARMATNSSGFGGPFTQFKVDTFAISSYGDLGQAPSAYASSILAHGVIDNLVVTFPPPPIQHEHFALAGGHGQQAFISRTNWNYVLQATTNFQTWSGASPIRVGTGGQVVLQDTNAAASNARFYRINASRAD